METIFMVMYRDDDKNRHMAFLERESEVKFVEDRFDDVYVNRVNRDFVAEMAQDNVYSD